MLISTFIINPCDFILTSIIMYQYKIMTTVEGIFWWRIIYPNYVFSVDFQAEKGMPIVCKCVLYSLQYVIYKETQ